MYKKISFVTFTFLIFIIPLTNASLIDKHEISIELDNKDIAHTKIDLTYNKITTNKISYLIFSDIINLKVKDLTKELDCDIETQEYGSQITCIPRFKSNYTIHLEFDALDLVSKSANAFRFNLDQSISDPTKELNFQLSLPERAVLVKQTDIFIPYHPETAKIGSTGRRIILSWDISSPKLGTSYTFSATFEKTPIIKDNYIIYIAIIIVLIIGLIILWKKKRPMKKETVFSILRKDEKRVLDVLIDKKGKCKQREIVRETDFSKAKVSRVIVDLEERGLIKKERVGRTNRIEVLDKSIIKKE